MEQLDLFVDKSRPAARSRPDPRAMRPQPLTADEADELGWVTQLGYGRACRRGPAGICSLRPMFFTAALVIGITPDGHSGRYCYALIEEAARALAAWDGRGDPPGDWIKFKGASSERFGPGLVAETR